MSFQPPSYEAHTARRGGTECEIVFEAPSLQRAHYAAELLLAADSLVNGAPSLFGQSLLIMPEDPPKNPKNQAAHTRFMSDRRGSATGLQLASIVAARISHRSKYQYALFKLRLSYQLCPVHIMDLDPSHWRLKKAVSEFPGDHVAFAYGLLSAYSAIEELGLEVRASSTNPSTTKDGWNPTVLQDLQKRLTKGGIDLSDSMVWHQRGTPSAVERKFPVDPSKKADWAARSIRDIEVGVEDAIRYAGRLRSKVVAHRLPSIASSLTHYDVANVQHVARRLLLDSVGCWRGVTP